MRPPVVLKWSKQTKNCHRNQVYVHLGSQIRAHNGQIKEMGLNLRHTRHIVSNEAQSEAQSEAQTRIFGIFWDILGHFETKSPSMESSKLKIRA